MASKSTPRAWNGPDPGTEALAGQKQYAAAEPLLQNGQKALTDRRAKIWPIDRDQTLRDAIDRLVRLYDAWDKPAEAEKRKKMLPPKPPANPAKPPDSGTNQTQNEKATSARPPVDATAGPRP